MALFKLYEIEFEMRYFHPLIIFLIILNSCNRLNFNDKLNVNIHSDTTLVLSKESNQDFIHAFKFTISGNIEEEITVIKTNGYNVAYKYELIGSVDTSFSGDWYSDTCLIKFENISKAIKDLEIEYVFYDI